MGIGKRYKILAVDDERSNLAALSRILSPEYEIITAMSGEDALKTASSASPDLILLDAIMPKMDGFSALVHLKEQEETKNIPVIIMAGLGGENDEERGFFLGAVDYISKPFKNAIVKARVRTHIMIVNQLRAIECLGLIDSLTDIPNRRSFDDRMEVEWRRCVRDQKPMSFLMMDLDNFKIYNDTYGHPQGDVLLREAAKIFSQAARRPSDMAARLGGEEFGVLLSDTDISGALLIAEKIRRDMEALRVPAYDGKTMTSATISIGAATTVPQETDFIKDFIERADEYLYAAKAAGRNVVFTRDAG
ncbi:MAG: diguanylate cyclase [Synergistaceae bacterium]|nr:diguanylate cyclase [Synergistaceae bacterium]